MKSCAKRRVSRKEYVSTNQLIISGSETPFSESLDPENQWDELANLYLKRYARKSTS